MEKVRRILGVLSVSLFLFTSALPFFYNPADAEEYVKFNVSTSVASGSFSTNTHAVPADNIIEPSSSTTININVRPGPASLTINVPHYTYGGFDFGGTYTVNFETPLGGLSVPVVGDMMAFSQLRGMVISHPTKFRGIHGEVNLLQSTQVIVRIVALFLLL